MTAKELLALVADWRRAAHQLRGDSEPMPASAMRLDECADELEAALPALCAEVEALRKDAERLDWLEKNTLSFNLRYPPYMGWLRWKTLLHPSRAAIDAAKEPK